MPLKLLRPQPLRKPLFHRGGSRRSFITLPGSSPPAPQTISTSRILPYAAPRLYALVADVDSYSSFLPYCQTSRVTKWSLPDANGNRWPSQADLTIGWGGFEETFTSRLFCLPGRVVEALGGEAVTSLPKEELKHHVEGLDGPARANNLFRSISTRWTVRPLPSRKSSNAHQPGSIGGNGDGEQTEVSLNIEFQFMNPIYAALSQAVTPTMAGIMIESFEKRAQKLLGNS
ncbi:cyclase/dehydrase family protein [Xylogone sp. PMI_703]|nr:cyclase/dehydrase family protein [Xylogone sp. PMI_703]